MISDTHHKLSQAVTTLKAKEQAQKDWPATLAGEAAKSREVVSGKLQGLTLQSSRKEERHRDHPTALTIVLQIIHKPGGYSRACQVAGAEAYENWGSMLAKFLRPYHLKLFFSSKLIHASVISKIDNKCIASTSSNNVQYRNILGEYAPKNDQKACEVVAKTLLEKLGKKQVATTAKASLQQCLRVVLHI